MNPKDLVGAKKVPISLIPQTALLEVGLAFVEGAAKYSPHNWRHDDIHASTYYNGAFRHMCAWLEGEDIDPDSGLSHITKAIAGLLILRDCIMQDKWIDDRPPKSKYPISLLNKEMERLSDRSKVQGIPPVGEV